ncbi:putative phiE125 gp8 family phage protein [Sphingomonas naasensis]|uniref:Phage gp6-like head-tail connector protein n=1 Tax=Sphingomonas naasensis TaxID=1344951 RepID=A0A4S1WEI6_9SPHN|nr:hypothetical protein [Sphingomonas naasensis]NIJ21620.1 putative phiE125 gp8 family phage protein [Sphingomonas naasensis]TGX41444.1 hypothetical protein E5A74_12490 [Sphingomonas naasensis]
MLAPPFPAAAIAAARDAVRLHLRITGAAEDALLETHAATALALCEAFTGQALIVRAWSEVLPAHGAWQRLPAAPVTTIDAVEGLGASGTGYALPPETYGIDIDAAGEGWVRGSAAIAAGRIRIGYAAGLAGDWSGLPAPLMQGVVLLAAHLFEARANGGTPPAAVAALWRPFRRMRLNIARRSA